MEAKGRPRRGQERPKGGQGCPKGGPGEAKGGQGRPRKARPGQETKKSKKISFLELVLAPFFGGPRPQKASQSQKNDLLKTELPFESGHFECEGQAKPGQRGLEKRGQGREGQ